MLLNEVFELKKNILEEYDLSLFVACKELEIYWTNGEKNV